MSVTSCLNRIAIPALFATGAALSASVSAAPVFEIVPQGPTFGLGQDATITYDVMMLPGGVPDEDNALVFHQVFFAYDPSVLTWTSLIWGSLLDGGTEADKDVLYADWTDYNPTASTLALELGTPEDKGSYFAGSLLLYQNATVPAVDLVGQQDAGGVLVSLTFDVDTSAAGYSDVVVLDDTDFNYATFPLFDYKVGPGSGTATWLDVQPSSAEVPVPATLVLLAAGLAGLGGIRRRRA